MIVILTVILIFILKLKYENESTANNHVNLIVFSRHMITYLTMEHYQVCHTSFERLPHLSCAAHKTPHQDARQKISQAAPELDILTWETVPENPEQIQVPSAASQEPH